MYLSVDGNSNLILSKDNKTSFYIQTINPNDPGATTKIINNKLKIKVAESEYNKPNQYFYIGVLNKIIIKNVTPGKEFYYFIHPTNPKQIYLAIDSNLLICMKTPLGIQCIGQQNNINSIDPITLEEAPIPTTTTKGIIILKNPSVDTVATSTTTTTTNPNFFVLDPTTASTKPLVEDNKQILGEYYLSDGNNFFYKDSNNNQITININNNKSIFTLKTVKNPSNPAELLLQIYLNNQPLNIDATGHLALSTTSLPTPYNFQYSVINNDYILLIANTEAYKGKPAQLDNSTSPRTITFSGTGNGMLIKLTEVVAGFSDIENFVDLPATEDYSRMLLKIASKSKSGVPNPYYFNPSRGFNFSIVFNNSAMLGDGTTSSSCDAIITSVADGQQIYFDKCYFVYSSDRPNIIQLSFKKQSSPDPLMISTGEFGDIAENLLIEQRFDIRLICQPSTKGGNIGAEILGLQGANLNNGFIKLINKNVIPGMSTITYTLNVGYTNNTKQQDILSYEVKLSSTLSKQDSAQEYTYGKMADVISDTLNDEIIGIVKPMFGLDNKLNMMEQRLKSTQDAYYYNNLGNGEGTYRFFNTN
jgi:hypothetical protein